jgi:hypothetical protein
MCGKVGSQPLLFGRALTDIDLAIQSDDMPASEVITVVTQSWLPSSGSEIIKVRSCICGHIIMVAGNRMGSGNVTSPGWIIAIRKFRFSTNELGIITRSKYTPGYIVQQRSGLESGIIITKCNIPRTY